MSRKDRERLRDILEAIDALRGHAALAELALDGIVRDAILYQLVVIGEAVKALPKAVTEAHSEVNWRGIAGLRDLLTHEYFRIDAARVDELLGEPLDTLERAIGEILTERGE